MTSWAPKVFHLSSFPDEIERYIFYLASTGPAMVTGSVYRYLFVARRVHNW